MSERECAEIEKDNMMGGNPQHKPTISHSAATTTTREKKNENIL